MKTCNKCQVSKEHTEFGFDKRNKDGLQGICNQCKQDANKALREKRVMNKAYKVAVAKSCSVCSKIKEPNAFYKDRAMPDGLATVCKECKNEKTQAWRKANKEHYNHTHKEYSSANYQKLRLQRYKITPEQFNNILANQKGLCAICEKPPKGKRPLAIDHCHTTGKVRGLLCYGCNRALHVLETKVLFEDAVAYLEKHK